MLRRMQVGYMNNETIGPEKALQEHIISGVPGNLEEEAMTFLGRSHGRRFFVTDTGLLGLAPRSTRVGDQVIGMVGSTIPFVVRPLETHSRAIQLVGFCLSDKLLDSVGTCEDMFIR